MASDDPMTSAARLKPRPLLLTKCVVSVVMAVIVGLFTRFMVLEFPAWSIGVAAAALCLGQLVKAALDDYEEDVRRAD